MKKVFISVALIFIVMQLFSQPLFTFGRYSVTKEEFLRAFNKNKIPAEDKEKALREYLDLYTKFKLKVKTAEEQRLDTLQQLIFDMQSFRSQVEEGYMNDEKGLNALIDEAIQRSQLDIRLLHFYTPINGDVNGPDSLKAYKAMSELANDLSSGKFNSEITAVTNKYPGIQAGDLGYITALTLPYDIENLAYNLQPGQFSKIHRTRTAIHIFKNAGVRKSAGRWLIAQILLSVAPGASGPEVSRIEKKADSVYKLLVTGADFKEMAKAISEDKFTYLNGGEMAEFGTGKFESAFENNVFALQKDGDISRPFLTRYGYHIVKRLQQKPTPMDKSDEIFVGSLKEQITKDSRISAAKTKFLKEIKIRSGYRKIVSVKDAELFRYADSVSVKMRVGNYPINKKTIFSFTKSTAKGVDWLNFVLDYKLNPDVYKGESNKQLLDKYISSAVFEYYRKHLEEYNGEFRNQMEEFKEGNMLFEIMERNVWSRAANDSTGIFKYYQDNKDKYRWGPSANILLFNTVDKKAAEDAAALLHDDKDWKRIAEESDGKLQVDSGRYELSQIQVPANISISEGLITPPLLNSGDNTASFVKILKIFPAGEQRSFEEARGLVINDYQNFLEDRWVQDLKKKYPVSINEQVFQSLLK